MLTELNEEIRQLVRRLSKKYDVDENNEVFYAYFFGVSEDDKSVENSSIVASIVDFVVQDGNELDYMLDVIREGYQENSINELLGRNISLN